MVKRRINFLSIVIIFCNISFGILVSALGELPIQPYCGRAENVTLGEGSNTGLGEFPWSVMIEYPTSSDGQQKFTCNGVLISSLYVLTAADCVKNYPSYNLLKVHAGHYDLLTSATCLEDPNKHIQCTDAYQTLQVASVSIHEKYKDRRGANANNLAVILLKTLARFNRFVYPICMPFTSELSIEPQPGEDLVVTGWGYINGRDSYKNIKQRIDLTHFDQAACARQNGNYFELQQTEICAAPKDKNIDNCLYFRGAPLVKKIGPQWVLEGILSDASCGFGNPSVYTRITEYKDWLVSIVDPQYGESKLQDVLPDIESCGISGESSVVRNTEAGLQEYPWAVVLEKNGEHICSGFLISRRHVVTSAFCVQNGVTHIIAGEYDTDFEQDCGDHFGENICNDRTQKIEVEEISPHESYSRRRNALLDNVAIIRLRDLVFISDTVAPICLPTTIPDYSPPMDMETMYVVGWGNTAPFGPVSTKKQKLFLPYVNSTACTILLEEYNFTPANSQLCAGSGKKYRVCNEFSGAVLMRKIGPNWVADGIFSGTFGCRPHHPGVYSKITSYENWIITKLGTTL